MKPASFDYCRPQSLAQAVTALESSESPRVLAGGQSLIPAMNFRLTDFSLLVDIGGLPGLDAIECDASGVSIGAAVTQSEALNHDAAAGIVPGLRAALRYVGHLQIRNRGTVCGSIAHADPAAELPALAVATGATICVQGAQGERDVAAVDFFHGPYWTALEQTDVITRVRFPAPPAGAVTIVDEISRRAGDFALAGLVAIVEADGDAVRAARLVAFGLCGTPTPLTAAETLMVGWKGGDSAVSSSDSLAEAVAADSADAFDDVHAPSWYCREAVAALVERAARRAIAAGARGRRTP